MNIVTTEIRDWNSSHIKQTEYTPDYQTLRITFVGGSEYVYKEITQSEYDEFCNAESQGYHFNKNFRKKEYTKIEKDDTNGNSQSN